MSEPARRCTRVVFVYGEGLGKADSIYLQHVPQHVFLFTAVYRPEEAEKYVFSPRSARRGLELAHYNNQSIAWFIQGDVPVNQLEELLSQEPVRIKTGDERQVFFAPEIIYLVSIGPFQTWFENPKDYANIEKYIHKIIHFKPSAHTSEVEQIVEKNIPTWWETSVQ